MPTQVAGLGDFVNEIAQLLRVVDESRYVLFRRGFRETLPDAIAEVRGRLADFGNADLSDSGEYAEALRAAGLTGAQLRVKLESFNTARAELDEEGGVDKLAMALDAGSVILGSLGGAIPAFGSFGKELLDFVLRELKKWRPWRRG